MASEIKAGKSHPSSLPRLWNDDFTWLSTRCTSTVPMTTNQWKQSNLIHSKRDGKIFSFKLPHVPQEAEMKQSCFWFAGEKQGYFKWLWAQMFSVWLGIHVYAHIFNKDLSCTHVARHCVRQCLPHWETILCGSLIFLVSEAWAAFCSGQSFLGCLYSEQPWKMQIVPPEQKTGTLLPINQDSGSLSSGLLFWNSTHHMGKHPLGHLSCSLGQGG